MNTTMIRKTIYVAVALIIAMSQPMTAQEVETVNPQPKDSVSLMVDSLQQVVSALSTTVKKILMTFVIRLSGKTGQNISILLMPIRV